MATGHTTAGRDLIREAWSKYSFEPEQELAIVQKDGAFLTARPTASVSTTCCGATTAPARAVRSRASPPMRSRSARRG